MVEGRFEGPYSGCPERFLVVRPPHNHRSYVGMCWGFPGQILGPSLVNRVHSGLHTHKPLIFLQA